MEKNLGFYRGVVERAVDDSFIEYEKGEKGKGELVRELVYEKSKFRRLKAAISLVKEIMPQALAEPLAKKLDHKDFKSIPFNREKLEFKDKLGEGFASKVYLLESKLENQPSFVLKVEFKQGGVEDLKEYAVKNRSDYRKISEIYKEVPGLVPEELSLLMTFRKDKKPAVATVQRFAGTNLRDVFSDFSPEELQEIFAINPKLKSDFIKFVDITVQQEKENGDVVDLLGKNNLSIAETENGPELKFVDPHLIYSTASGDKDKKERLEEAIRHLASIKESLESQDSDVAA